ncbi:MAG: hypothetical protein NTV97_21615 [Alphaproteobacteria bacterium]|nr:hypothetical protein [Alphaproteobacteria bacterium]
MNTNRTLQTTPVTEMDLAAWLDGNLPETAAARVEAAMAADPDLRNAAFELADILGKPLPAAPPRMAVRAQALVGFEVERQAPRQSWLASLFPSFIQGLAMQRGAMAGVAVMVAAVGFMMGGGLGETYAHERYGSNFVAPFGSDTTNDLNDLFSDIS